MTSASRSASTHLRVAVVGAGAAGLAAARILSRNGIRPTVFEKEPFHHQEDENGRQQSSSTKGLGGIWNYVEGATDRPVYKGLRTNLPKEIMAFREYPWTNVEGKSYLTHQDVLAYLQSYANEYSLKQFIRDGCTVDLLRVDPDRREKSKVGVQDMDDESLLPLVNITWTSENSGTQESEDFDAVLVCNGHFSLPSIPPIKGIESFPGTTMHSIAYDQPSAFQGQIVLCIGGMASGSDIARELSQHARHVYLSNSKYNSDTEVTYGKVTLVPLTQEVDGRCVQFSGTTFKATNIDAIIFCTGYDYSFPFLREPESQLNVVAVPGERRVTTLYDQLWHVRYPNVSFIGLPHAIIPFPLFEFQCEAVTAHLLGQFTLPSLPKRIEQARVDAEGGGPNPNSDRIQDTHYLGQYQWDYCRKLASYAELLTPKVDAYISGNQTIYTHSSDEKNSLNAGEPDSYRSTIYKRNEDGSSFSLVSSLLSN